MMLAKREYLSEEQTQEVLAISSLYVAELLKLQE